MKKVLLIFTCLFLFLTGCSRLDIAFNWADTYIASKVDDYFDISSKQSKELKRDIKKDLQKLKVAVFPTWIERLKGISQEVQDGSINDARVAFYFALFMKDVEQMNSHFADTAVAFIASTSPKQIEYFDKSFHKKNQEDLEKSHNIAKMKHDARDKYEEWFEMFLGTLTDEQKKLMTEHLEHSPFPAELKVKNKEFVFQKFLTHRNSAEEMKKFVHDYYAHPEIYDLPEYRQAYNKYQKDLQTLITQVFATLTEKQRVALKTNIADKTTMLEYIIQRS